MESCSISLQIRGRSKVNGRLHLSTHTSRVIAIEIQRVNSMTLGFTVLWGKVQMKRKKVTGGLETVVHGYNGRDVEPAQTSASDDAVRILGLSPLVRDSRK